MNVAVVVNHHGDVVVAIPGEVGREADELPVVRVQGAGGDGHAALLVVESHELAVLAGKEGESHGMTGPYAADIQRFADSRFSIEGAGSTHVKDDGQEGQDAEEAECAHWESGSGMIIFPMTPVRQEPRFRMLEPVVRSEAGLEDTKTPLKECRGETLLEGRA